MHRKVEITKGSSGWGGLLVLESNEICNRVLCVIGGDIHPAVARIAEMTGAETVDGFKTTVPDEQVLTAVVDCGGTTRRGVYPKKRISTVNLVPVGAVGSLIQYVTEDIHVSDVKEDTIVFTDEEVKVEKVVKETKEPGAPKTKVQARKELAEANQGKKPRIIARTGIGVGQMANKFLAAGCESIEMVIKNVSSFMTFTSTILGIIQVNGLGNIVANTIPPLCSTVSGMIIVSLICGLPFLSPILGLGAVIARVIETLSGAEIGSGSAPAQYILSVLFATDTQVGGGSVPVDLSLGEAEPEAIESDVPTVLHSCVITGSLVVIITFVFSTSIY